MFKKQRTRRVPPTTELLWIDMHASEASDHPTAVADIEARRLDGITVSGVFTPDEAATAVENLKLYHGRRRPAVFGTMLGMPLAELRTIGDGRDRSVYFDDAQRCRELYVDAFGFDPHRRVSEVVTPMAGGRTVGHPVDEERPYSAGNVRWYEPGLGGLSAHVGNEFQTHRDATTQQLRTTTRTLDHISWFVILQAPEEGGALSVYDLLFETHTPAQAEYREWGRDDSDFDDRPARRISPAAGGLVFFGGGWRWHRVDKVLGPTARITYGGFAGPSLDGSALNLWF